MDRYSKLRLSTSRLIITLAALVLTVASTAKCLQQQQQEPAKTTVQRSVTIKSINEQNWHRVLKTDGEWLIMFKADWCPACKQFKAAFENVCKKQQTSAANAGSPVFSCAVVDVESSPGLTGRFQANMLPTIYHVKRNEYRKYAGYMNQKGLDDFVYDMQWQAATPVPSYLSPGSPHMRIVQEVYTFADKGRTIYEYFVKTQKMPPWLVYILFVITVILVGLLIGLATILFIDGVYWLLWARNQNGKEVSGNGAVVASQQQSSQAGGSSRAKEEAHAAPAVVSTTNKKPPSRPFSVKNEKAAAATAAAVPSKKKLVNENVTLSEEEGDETASDEASSFDDDVDEQVDEENVDEDYTGGNNSSSVVILEQKHAENAKAAGAGDAAFNTTNGYHDLYGSASENGGEEGTASIDTEEEEEHATAAAVGMPASLVPAGGAVKQPRKITAGKVTSRTTQQQYAAESSLPDQSLMETASTVSGTSTTVSSNYNLRSRGPRRRRE